MIYYSALSHASNVQPPQLPDWLTPLAANVNDQDAAKLDWGGVVKRETVGPVFYPIEALGDKQAMLRTQRLLVFAPKAQPFPYDNSVTGWPVMGDTFHASIQKASSDIDQQHRRLVRDHGGGWSPEGYLGDWCVGAGQMSLYMTRITAFAIGAGCGAKVYPTICWRLLWPMFEGVKDELVPYSASDWEQMIYGLAQGGASGAIIADHLDTQAKADACGRFFAQVEAPI